jgi:hypothetical protein
MSESIRLFKRISISFFLAFISIQPAAHAASQDLYEYVSSEGCDIKRFVNQKWLPAPGVHLRGARFPIVRTFPSQVVLISYNQQYYSIPPGCTRQVSNAAQNAKPGKWSAQLRGAFTPMGKSGGTELSNRVTTTTGTGSPGLGFDARLGYRLSDRSLAFLSAARFSETQSSLTSTNVQTLESYSGLSVNLGYQYNFTRSKKWIWYGAASAGLTFFSDEADLTGAVVGNFKVTKTAPDLTLELGSQYHFTERLSGILALNYSFLTISDGKVSESNLPSTPVGASTGSSASYSRLAIQLGVMFEF